MVTTCIIFLFHNTSHLCFLPPSDLPTTYCGGKIIYCAAFNDFHSFFQCFCGHTSLNFAFLHLFLSPTSLYTCVEVSVSVFFAFLMLIFFNLSHIIASSFLSSSINHSCFCWKKKLCSLGLICFIWDFLFLHWAFLCRFCTFLSWTSALLELILAWGGWRFCSCCCCALGFGEN